MRLPFAVFALIAVCAATPVFGQQTDDGSEWAATAAAVPPPQCTATKPASFASLRDYADEIITGSITPARPARAMGH